METKTKPYDALEIADYIIYKATVTDTGINGDSDHPDLEAGITNMKLQKILYFAQGHYLGKFGEPLFKEEIEAWKYGPVVREVYDKYKNPESESQKYEPILKFEEEANISDMTREFLDSIWDTYGFYSATFLANATHSQEPWLKAWNKEGGSTIITRESMKRFFK